MSEEEIVLVDARDNALGTMPKLQAHIEGRLHRAVSVFVFDREGRMLLQRRATGKYHSGGLWSNASCTHPRPGETPHGAAVRRLEEEMGLTMPLDHSFAFVYRAELDDGLIEHELDHVFIGVSDIDPRPNSTEVMDWRWIAVDRLDDELREMPDRFTAWFRLAVPQIVRQRSPTDVRD